MSVADAQREMCDVYLNGALGQAVSGAIWLMSSVAATTVSTRAGIGTLVVGGMAIFPVTQGILLLTGRAASVSRANPLRELAPQVALVAPLLMPLAAAATLYRTAWFYPAFMIIVGAHYLPFAFLYGRRAFLALALSLVVSGVFIARMPTAQFAVGGWVASALLIGFACMSISLRPNCT